MSSIISKTGEGCRLKFLFATFMVVVLFTTLTCCMAFPTDPPIEEYYPVQENGRVFLPAPVTKGTVSLEEALHTRRSVREYASEPLSLDDVSQLLYAGQGITSPAGLRTTPSAGALYPLELFIASSAIEGLMKGVYQYQPTDHSLVLIGEGDF